MIRNALQLQIKNCTEVNSDRNNTKHTNEPYDSRGILYVHSAIPPSHLTRLPQYQNHVLKKILAAVCDTEDERVFLKPAHVLHPEIYDNYMALIAEPIDLRTMRHMLHHNRYKTMAEFRRHVDLLEHNAREYNDKCNESITATALNVKSEIYRRMDWLPSEPPLRGESVPQIRRIVDTNTEGANGGYSDEGQNTSHEEAVGSKAESGPSDGFDLVLQLGRLCVARNAEA